LGGIVFNNGFSERRDRAYGYYVNFDRPDGFFADVRNTLGKTVFELHDTQIIEAGVMCHKRDVAGLRDYLVEQGLMDRSHMLLLMAA
jgi:hypothetical protein